MTFNKFQNSKDLPHTRTKKKHTDNAQKNTDKTHVFCLLDTLTRTHTWPMKNPAELQNFAGMTSLQKFRRRKLLNSKPLTVCLGWSALPLSFESPNARGSLASHALCICVASYYSCFFFPHSYLLAKNITVS